MGSLSFRAGQVITVLLVLALLAVGCTSEGPVTQVPPATAAPAPTYTPLPTYTPYPTYTPVPTATLEPTLARIPAPAATEMPAHARTPEVEMDRAALIALYQATGGPGWINNTNWAGEAPLRQWYGVTTNAHGRVTELFLQENRLTGELPAELGDLSELRILGLWSNELTGEIPPELARLTDLEQFAVGGNRLHGTVPEWLADFRNLEELHLPTNRFTGQLPAWLGDLPLRRLILGNNRFDGDIPEELGNLRYLRALWLGGNDLTGCIPDELREVPDNDFAASGVPFCSEIAQARTPEPEVTSLPTKIPMPTPTPLPVAIKARYIDDPGVPYLKWEVGPEVTEEQYGNLRAGIVYMHRYASELGLRPLPDDATFYLYHDLNLAARTLARLENRSVESARRAFVDRSWGGLAGLEDADSGWIMVNLLALAQHDRSSNFMRIAAHELSHVHQYTLQGNGRFSYTHSEVRVIGPAWLQEGGAEFHAMAALAKAGVWPYEQRHQHYANEAREVDVSLKEMEIYDVLLGGPGRFGLAAMGAELLAAKAGEEALITYWTLVRPGTTWQEAFETAFGMTIDEFYPLFEEHRATGFSAPDTDLPGTVSRVPLADTDRAALTALYESAGGVYWANKGNWLSDEPGSRWHGVTTDPEGHVTVLDLRDNRLSGELPAGLGNLRKLRELRLNENQLSSEIPTELGRLANLEVLSVSRNRLSGPIPSELGELSGLRDLSIWRNELSGEIPSTLANLTELTHFSVGVNELTGEIPSWLGDLTNLRSFHLNENQITGAIPDNLAKLTNMEYLNVNRNRLTGQIPSWLADLPLRQLFLNDNRFTGEIPEEFLALSELEWLWLGGNSLTGCVPAGLRGVPENDLHRLGLPDC